MSRLVSMGMTDVANRDLLTQSWECLKRSRRALHQSEEALARAVYLRAFFMAIADRKSLPSGRHGEPEQIREKLRAGGGRLSAGQAR
jgi:hypothetical protein